MKHRVFAATLIALLASGFGSATDAPSSPSKIIAIADLVPAPQEHDYDREILIPLRKAQVEAAEKARVAVAEAARAAAEARAAHTAAQRAPMVLAAPTQVTARSAGSHTDWMASAGISPSDFGYADYIITHESGWRWWVANNEGSGATGLGQALPASKMAPYGADYLTNPVTQLRWANAYAVERYGSWAGAYQHWLTYHVW